jgi:vitamin B12 transporter
MQVVVVAGGSLAYCAHSKLSRAGSWQPTQENLMRASHTLFTAGFIALTAAAGAAKAADGEPPETIVVTATRVPTPESQIASSITIVTAADIAARQDQTLPEALQDVPGLNVVQTGGPGEQTSVFMRGTDSNHVKVLVDGIDVGDPSSPVGAFDFGQFLTPDIDRIEILRGPQSGLYGSDAIGGVINVITKNGSGPAQFTADIDGGSFDTINQSGGVSGSTGPFHYTANIEHFYSGATPVTPLNLLTPGEARIDDSYDNITGSTKLGYDVADNFDLGLVARYTNTQLLFTGDNFNVPPLFIGVPDATHDHTDTVQYYTRGTEHLVLFGGFLEQTVGLAYGSISSTDFSPDGPATNYYSGDRVKADWQGNLKFSDSETLILGLESGRDEIRLPISAATTTNSGYAELQSALGADFFNTLSVRYDDNDRFGSAVTYRVAPAWLIPATGTKLKASLGTGFKAPTLSQMFESFPSFGFFGNPGLKPEKSLGYDAGFEQSLLGDRVQFGATYFRNNISNLIDVNASFTRDINVGRAETDGVESFIAYQPIQSVTLRADYTFTEANDEILDQELLRRPKNKLTLDAKWQASDALSFDADIRYVSSWVDVTRDSIIPQVTAPGYATADIAASYDITDRFTVYGRINNLLDEHYQDPVGFLQPGRGFYAGIKAKI